MYDQINFEEYIVSQRKIFPSCSDCVCNHCLFHCSGRCPYGNCFDDKRALEHPYDAAHPGEPLRTAWSNWDKPGEQAHWCRGGIFYPSTYCKDFIKYKGCEVKECLKENVVVYQDGYIGCSLVDTFGCENCYKEFEQKLAFGGEGKYEINNNC